ncbi:hypothetical protein [Streptomyces sp. Je 1-369]|uniref:SCO3933 family regulatory protein n=1 Tax=Streptomyces sp. Je 1-369 TaxID=2966192 RepID=UPI0022858E1F|nr:hypothetical protein [Streptomyces sp. Je 1-369]WAL96539.1 hypothetical protein NOO62_19880 [Streptomyces sp. Je 1-369]
MAMTRIPVRILDTTIGIVGTLPEQRYVDMEKTQESKDRDTGERLFHVTVMLMEDGRAEMMRITVPESGLPNGLQIGSVVRPVDLFATPWARINNGNLSDGVAYRAKSLDLATPPAPAAQPAASAESKKAA